MKIELATLKRIAKAVPDLTVAQLVAVWAEKIEDQRREIEKARIAERRTIAPTSANIGPTSCNNGQHPPTREDEERALFAQAKEICGKLAGGMVATLLKKNGYDIKAVGDIFVQARSKADPRAYVAAACRGTNGAADRTMAAFDDLIARATHDEGEASPAMRDITPTGGEGG